MERKVNQYEKISMIFPCTFNSHNQIIPYWSKVVIFRT